MSFVSQLYTGRISDREIVMRSGFWDQQFNNGDSFMVDKGFTIDDLLPPGVGLNIPPFLGMQGQMSAEFVHRGCMLSGQSTKLRTLEFGMVLQFHSTCLALSIRCGQFVLCCVIFRNQ